MPKEVFFMKSKAIIILSSVLGCAALVGAGFSAWVITQGDSKTADGTIVVDSVTDKTVAITTSWKNSLSTITFGGLATHPTGAWLIDSDKTENLTCTLSITVTNYTVLNTLSVACTEVDAGAGKYSTAASANLVGALPTFTDQKSACTTGTGTFDLPVTFTWGSAFGNENPETYYSGKDYATYGAEAKTKLNALNTDLTRVSFRLTITATVA
jgi:hypothetical protein